MAHLDNLIASIKDDKLRAELRAEWNKATKGRSLGLVFDRHLPESLPIPKFAVQSGDKVQVMAPQSDDPTRLDGTGVWTVAALNDGVLPVGMALLKAQEVTRQVAASRLVRTFEFGDPIFPGLRSTGRVVRGGGIEGDDGGKPFHTVITAENYHALEALLFAYEGRIDAIYIDPPYNTGARDWKYDNDYVDENDGDRHSKWLSFMEKRLLLAKRLLKPDASVLIVTIDEKEYLRLGLLLEQTFPGFKIQMISSVINPRGVVRGNEFSRSNEFVYFVWTPGMTLQAPGKAESAGERVAWETMRRRSLPGRRGGRGPGACGPNQFFAIHVDPRTGSIVGRGEPLPLDFKVSDYRPPRGTVAVFPARDDGTEMNWSLTDTAFDLRWSQGYVRAGKATPSKPQKYVIQYILGGVIEDIAAGRARVVDRAPDGSVVAEYVEDKTAMPQTQWDIPSHNAQENGTGLLRRVLPDRKFPYAKSLYAVEDALRIFVAGNKNAVVLDFFAGSGTTAHAVMRLNHGDGGRRRAICVTNNEVSVEEATQLRARHLKPGDAEWERWGICDYITKPRIEAAVTGRTPTGEPIEGEYRFVDEFPMSLGFAENVEFFTLTYEDAEMVEMGRRFSSIAPLLWLKAGATGERVDKVSGLTRANWLSDLFRGGGGCRWRRR